MSDLLKELQEAHRESSSWRLFGLCHQAADRIAALEAQLAERVKVKPLETIADGTLNIDAAVACVMELFPGADRQALQCLASLMAKTAHPVSTASVTKARQAVERLANAKMDLTLSEWSELSSAILTAIETTPPAPNVTECATEDCERTATVRFERGGIGSDYCRDCYMSVQAITAAQEVGNP